MRAFIRICFCLAGVAIGLATAAEAAVPTVPAGKPAPDFAFTDATGQRRTLAEFRGKIVVLEWLNPACPFVVRHYRSGNMQSTQAVAAEAGAVWLQINSTAMGDSDLSKSLEWQKKQGVVATAYVRDQEGKIGRLFGAQTTPHLYVIATDGTLAYQGAIDDQPQGSQATAAAANNYVKAALAALKAGRPVEKAVTEPYGCGVKYSAGP